MNAGVALGIYGAIFALLAFGVLRSPPVALTAVNCIFGLKQWGQSTNDWLLRHSPATNIAIGCLVLVALVNHRVRVGCIFCRISPVTWLTLVLFAYSALSLFWTRRPDLATDQWLLQIPYYVTFMVLVPLIVKEIDDFRVATRWLLGVGGILLTVLLLLGNWGARGLVLELVDDETNPLALAALAGSVAVAALFVGFRLKSVPVYLLRLALVGVSLLVIIRSGSRGQLIGIVLVTAVMMPVAYRLLSGRGVMTAAVAAVTIVFALKFGFATYVVGHDEAGRWAEADATDATTGRLANSLLMLSLWSKSVPTLIFGLGNSAAYDPRVLGIYPHNVVVEVLTEEGLVGIVLYGAVVAATVGALYRLIRATGKSVEDRAAVAAIGAIYLFFFIISLKQGSMIGSIEFFMYSMLIGNLWYGYEARATVAPQTSPVAAVRDSRPFPNILS